jgi:hypothetical protein
MTGPIQEDKMFKQSITKKFDAPSAKAWDAVRGIGRLDVWFSFLATCKVEGSGVGAARYMTISDEYGGGDIKDIIEEIDNTSRKLVYSRPISPFPVTSYLGTVEVFESYDGNAVLVWTIDYESSDEDRASVAHTVYNAISDGLNGMERDLRSSLQPSDLR